MSTKANNATHGKAYLQKHRERARSLQQKLLKSGLPRHVFLVTNKQGELRSPFVLVAKPSRRELDAMGRDILVVRYRIFVLLAEKE